MKFKVIAPKGFNFAGKQIERGTVFDAQSKSAHVQTGLHFKQIVEVPDKKAAEVPYKPEKPEKEDPAPK